MTPAEPCPHDPENVALDEAGQGHCVTCLLADVERLRGMLSHIVNRCEQVTIAPNAKCTSIAEVRAEYRRRSQRQT